MVKYVHVSDIHASLIHYLENLRKLQDSDSPAPILYTEVNIVDKRSSWLENKTEKSEIKKHKRAF
jgi:hypothetical protein